MEHTDSSSALMLLQYGGDDTDDENTTSDPVPIPEMEIKSPKLSKGQSSDKELDLNSPSRRISEDSFGKHVAAMISDEEGDHHDSERKREHNSDRDAEGEMVVPIKRTMIDVSHKMAPSVSPYDDNSGSSFPDSQRSSKSQKKYSRPPNLVPSYGDFLEEDEGDSESSDDSQEEDSSEKSHQSSVQENPVVLHGTRALVGMDSNNIQLPPEPPGKCPKELQDKITDLYTQMKQKGFDTNNEIQRLTSFRNPSIYEKLIQMHHIDEKGSNFPLEVYNPHMWGKESFYDELDKAQKKDMERREKERKTKIEFISGTKKSVQSVQPMDNSAGADEKKRKSKWDALPPGLPSQPQRSGSSSAPSLTSSASGTRATVISAVGTLTKKASFSIINTTGPSK